MIDDRSAYTPQPVSRVQPGVSTLLLLAALAQDFAVDEVPSAFVERFRGVAARKDWPAVFRAYDEARTKHRGRLLRDGDAWRDPADALARAIRGMPEALAWWRAEKSGAAEFAFERAGDDPAALARFADDFRFDERAADALALSGRLWALFEEQPDAVTAARLAIAAVVARDEGALARVKHAARNLNSDVIAGTERVSLKTLLARLAIPTPPVRERTPDDPTPPIASCDVELWSARVVSGDRLCVPAATRLRGRDVVLVADANGVLAIDPSRAPTPGVLWRVVGKWAGRDPRRRVPEPASTFGVTVDRDLAVAAIGSARSFGGARRLVACDLRGDVRWDTDDDALHARLGEPFWEDGWTFAGPPVARDGRLFAVATATSMTEARVAALCLDRRTGEPLWFAELGGAPVKRGMPAPLPSLVESGGLVLVHTNLGATAALDAASGRVRWLSTYARTGAARPASPAIVHRGLLYALPQDAREWAVFDIETGARVEREPQDIDWSAAKQLAGATGDWIVVAGAPSRVVHVPTMKSYGLYGSDVTGDARAAFADGKLHLPTREGVSVVETVGWRVQDASRWPTSNGPGAVAVAGDRLVVVSRTHVSVYASESTVDRAFAPRLAPSPPNVDAHLEHARLMHGSGRLKRAAASYRVVLDMTGRQDVKKALHDIYMRLGEEASQ
jgi:hypothetical protein